MGETRNRMVQLVGRAWDHVKGPLDMVATKPMEAEPIEPGPTIP